MTPSPSAGDNKARAAVLVLLAIGLASTQDAIIKAMSGTYPVYETMLIRGLTSLPILGVWLAYTHGLQTLFTPLWPRIFIRALILCTAYLAFILAIAAMPIANMVAIYFTMPFFVAGLAGPFLGERVPYYRWIAIVAGFAGVIVMVRPGMQAFEPAALLALYSAFGYAIGQMMGRDLAQRVEPLVIANWQNAVYFIFAAVVGVIAQASGFCGREPQEPGLSHAAIRVAHASRLSAAECGGGACGLRDDEFHFRLQAGGIKFCRPVRVFRHDLGGLVRPAVLQ